MKKVAYITNIAPHYREKLWLVLAKGSGVELHFFYGENPNQSIEPIDFQKEEWKDFQDQIHELKNIKFKKRLIFQRKAIRQIVFKKWDCILLLGDANLLSNWIIAILARIKRVPVIFWGHGIYGNESSYKWFVRKTFLSLGNINLVYGHWAKNLMIHKNKFKENKVKVIYNSVDYEASLSLREDAIVDNFYYTFFKNDLPTIVFIGRLTNIKKLDLLIYAVHKLNKDQKKYNLILIGDGEARSNLEELAKELKIDVYFYGACYDEQKISEFIANADLCVSPGNVGLTSIHSMSYGTPVCTNNDFKNQMPEFEAIKEGETGCFFDKTENNLAETISQWFQNAPKRQLVRKNCYEVVDNFYNPIVQVNVLNKTFDEILNTKPKVAFFTNIAPHYRERLWIDFAQKLDVELHFYFGHNNGQSIAEIDFDDVSWKGLEDQLHKTSNFRINKRLIFQRQVIRQVIFKKWDAVLLLGDANIISNWIITFIVKLRGIPVIFWGHGVYGNENKLKKFVRKNFLRFADVNLVYGNWSKNLLIKEKFNPDTVKVIYNSVNYEISKPLREKAIIPNFYNIQFNNNWPTLIFIGRLTKSKKLDMLIKAIYRLKLNSENYNLVLIGDGEVQQNLKDLSKELKVNSYFHGACYDEVQISKFIANADLCVSPGNVGLTSVHAMSYGTPVCTTNDFKNQGPEFEAIKAWKTGCFFDQNKRDIAETISKWFNSKPDREIVRHNCYKVVDTYYNPSLQVKVLKGVLADVLK